MLCGRKRCYIRKTKESLAFEWHSHFECFRVVGVQIVARLHGHLEAFHLEDLALVPELVGSRLEDLVQFYVQELMQMLLAERKVTQF